MGRQSASLACFVLQCIIALPATGSDLQMIGPAAIVDGLADVRNGSLKWSNGGFIHADFSSNGMPPVFSTFDAQGNLVTTTELKIPEAAQYWFCAFDRRNDGAIVFAGGVYSGSGQPGPLIALILPNGKSSRIIRTYPYYPYMVSFAPDRTFWTVGMEMINHEPLAPGLDENAGVLRHFDEQGTLVGSYMPQYSFAKSGNEDRLSAGRLVAKRARVGWYAPVQGGIPEYIEFSTKSLTAHAFPGLRTAPRDLVSGFTVTDNGSVFITVQDSTPKVRTHYRLDRDLNRWLSVNVPGLGKESNFAPELIGSEGDRLLFRSGSSVARFGVQ